MEFVIKSNISDKSLAFSDLVKSPNGAVYVSVELRGRQANGRMTIYVHHDATGIVKMFQKLAQLGKPWEGAETWVPVERDFSLAITCDRLGHVCFEVRMRPEQGDSEDSFVSARLVTDLSDMPSIARDAETFFGAI